jgi:plasmid maintenance system killer protein
VQVHVPIADPVDLVFATNKLQKLCESQRELQRVHGQSCARKAMGRLQDLEAAATLEDMRTLPGKCHELVAERAGQVAIRLSDGKRLILEPATSPPPTKSDGGLDWTKVTSVRILAIEDYHRG